jgi:hypothetical protein
LKNYFFISSAGLAGSPAGTAGAAAAAIIIAIVVIAQLLIITEVMVSQRPLGKLLPQLLYPK